MLKKNTVRIGLFSNQIYQYQQNPSLYCRAGTEAASKVAFRCVHAICLIVLRDSMNASTLQLQLHNVTRFLFFNMKYIELVASSSFYHFIQNG